ncbi:hypothetical protein H0H93_012570 [Arthromyces matolae]|nr:hypothetical protein H0H93_012570 [Arthromyces matolae]
MSSARYAPLNNNDLDAAFDDESQNDDEQHHPLTTSTTTETTPLVIPGAYDFEREYDFPPPGSPPAPSTTALPNDYGNSNGQLPTSTPLRPQNPSQPSFFRRTVGALLPSHYVRIPTRATVGSGSQNDGVFSNVVAKPALQRTTTQVASDGSVYMVPELTSSQKDVPPTYTEAQADAVPPYWETTVHVPAGSNINSDPNDPNAQVIIDDLPVGRVWIFFSNLFISFFFQFVGFLFTYLLHTSHAAKFGSRAGLGLTLIQFGFYSRSIGETPAEGEGTSTSTSTETPQTLTITSHDWVAFLFMTLGWFIFLTAIIGYIRLKRWEKSIRSPPPASSDSDSTSAAPRILGPFLHGHPYLGSAPRISSARPSSARRAYTPEEMQRDREIRRNLANVFGIEFDEREEEERRRERERDGILLCIGLFIVWYFFSPQLRTAKAWLDSCVEQELRRINDGFGEFAALVEHELRRANVGATFDGTSETLRRGSNVGDSRPHSIEELEEFKFRPAPLTTLPGLLSLSSPVVCHGDVCPRHVLPAAPLPNSLIVFNINIPHSLKVALGCLILGSLSFAARHRQVQSPLVEVAIVNTPCSNLGPEVPVDLDKIALMTPLPPDAESDFPVQDLFALALTIPLPPDRQQDFPVRDLFAVALTVSLPPDQEQDFSPAPLPPPEEEDFPIDDFLIFPRELSDIPPHGPFALAPTTPLPGLWTDYIVEESFQYPPRGSFPYEPEYLFPLTNLDNTFFKLALQTPLPPDLDSDLLDEHLLAVRTPLPEDKESEWDDETSREIAQERCKVLVEQWKRATGRDSVEPLSSFNQPSCVLGAHNGTSAPPKEEKKGKEPEVKLSAIEIRKAQIAEARRRTTNKHPSSSYRHSYGLPSHVVPSTPPKDDDKENAMMAQMSPQERRQAIIKKRARACLYDTELPSSSYKPATSTAAPAGPSTIHIPRPPPPTTPSLDEADKAAIHTRLRELREATRETRAEKNKQRDETPVKRFEWSREAQLANLDIGKERVKLGVGESEFYMPPAPTTGPRAHQYDPDPENPAKVVRSTSEEIRELLVILYADKNRDEIDALTLEYLNFK